jgi:hypothetical protein
MALNDVLNRPLFRQQALKKGALKPIKARIGQMIGPPTVNVTGQMQRNFPVAINQQGFFGRNIRPAMQRTGQFLKGQFGLRPLTLGAISSTGTAMLSDDILTKLGVTGPLKTGINFAAGVAGLTPYGRGIGYAYSGLKGLAALADKIRKDNPRSFVGLEESDPYGTTFDQITGPILGGEPLLTGDQAINPFRPLDPTKPRGRGALKKQREKEKALAKAAAGEGSEVAITGNVKPDALVSTGKEELGTGQNKTDVIDITKVASNNAQVPGSTIGNLNNLTKGPTPLKLGEIESKPDAPIKEKKTTESQIAKDADAVRSGKFPGTDNVLALAREYFNELNEGQPPSQAKNVFLATLASGLLSGTTRKQGLGGALEVLGNALGPAVNNQATIALKEGELRAKNREASLASALDHMKLLNTGAKSPERTAGVIQYRTVDGELRNVAGFQLKDGTIQRPVIVDGQQFFVTVPQGGDLKDAEGNVIGRVQQFRVQKEIGKRLFDIQDVLGNRYTAYSTALDVLKTLNQLTPEGEKKKAGVGLTVDTVIRRTKGVAMELFGIDLGQTAEEAAEKLEQIYNDEVAAINRDPNLSPEAKQKAIEELNLEGLKEESKKILGDRIGGFSNLSRTEQEKLAVQETSLVYALANTFKDQDRLTQRDINAAREIVNIFSLSRSSKDVEATITAIANQLSADIARQERLYTAAGGLYSSILDLRKLKNFTPESIEDIGPSLQKAFRDEKEIRETLQDVKI